MCGQARHGWGIEMIYCYNLSGVSPTHIWARSHHTIWTRWYIVGNGPFTRSGWAVMDDFGTLVEVPA